MQTIRVSHASGEADFSSLQEALDSVSAVPANASELPPVVIRIAPGIYREKIHISRGSLTLEGCGASPSDVVITYDDYAFAPMEDGSKRGTFRSYTMLLDANNVTLKNLTVENASGDEHTHGQAIALYADGDGLLFDHIRLLGRQDTLFTGPLPPKEAQPGGFIGPKQFAPRINGRQHYRNCYICGNVDFIFGSATAYFEDCTIESLAHSENPSDIQGYITAPSTAEGQSYGYVFFRCRFISSQCAAGTCYLARPWREFAQAVFLSCDFGPHIHRDGFHDWNKTQAHDTILFATNDCHRSSSEANSGAAYYPQAPFAKALTDAECARYARSLVLGEDAEA